MVANVNFGEAKGTNFFQESQKRSASTQKGSILGRKVEYKSEPDPLFSSWIEIGDDGEANIGFSEEIADFAVLDPNLSELRDLFNLRLEKELKAGKIFTDREVFDDLLSLFNDRTLNKKTELDEALKVGKEEINQVHAQFLADIPRCKLEINGQSISDFNPTKILQILLNSLGYFYFNALGSIMHQSLCAMTCIKLYSFFEGFFAENSGLFIQNTQIAISQHSFGFKIETDQAQDTLQLEAQIVYKIQTMENQVVGYLCADRLVTLSSQLDSTHPLVEAKELVTSLQETVEEANKKLCQLKQQHWGPLLQKEKNLLPKVQMDTPKILENGERSFPSNQFEIVSDLSQKQEENQQSVVTEEIKQGESIKQKKVGKKATSPLNPMEITETKAQAVQVETSVENRKKIEEKNALPTKTTTHFRQKEKPKIAKGFFASLIERITRIFVNLFTLLGSWS